jgi:polysaccharide biosynthesis/export protein
MSTLHARLATILLVCGAVSVPVAARQAPAAPQPANGKNEAAAGVVLPPRYVIGPADVLTIVFWRDKDLSVDAKVRPDGKISLPLLNDVEAAGFTPEELRLRLIEQAAKYVKEPNATVIVREINSRNVFITGNVGKPGSYVLHNDMNVLQLIAQAGGLLEYADRGNIRIIRNGREGAQYLPFNYKDVSKGKHLEQNILLQPGDTVIVP